MPSPSASIEKGANSIKSEMDEMQVRAKVDAIRSDIAGLASAVGDYGANKAGEMKATARGAANDLSDSTMQALDSAKHELAVLERSLRSHVRQNPLQSLAIAAGVGVLAAIIMRR